MQSNGGMLPATEVMSTPVFSIESGPAVRVVAALAFATQLGSRDAITFDMGGTTAKASLIEDGQVSRSSEYEVGGRGLDQLAPHQGSGLHLVRIATIPFC
jgi:N-methylhydantoinase A